MGPVSEVSGIRREGGSPTNRKECPLRQIRCGGAIITRRIKGVPRKIRNRLASAMSNRRNGRKKGEGKGYA